MGRTAAEAHQRGRPLSTLWTLLAVGAVCTAAPAPIVDPNDPPEYYAFDLVTTGRLPGTGLATGSADVVFSDSPFGISIGQDGSYQYDVKLRVTGLHLADQGVLTVWFTTPDLSQVVRSGVVEPGAEFSGQVAWNKFLAVVTMEPADDPSATMWTGPVVLRGMSRSGMMHTMAGHGPFETENCATYGYR